MLMTGVIIVTMIWTWSPSETSAKGSWSNTPTRAPRWRSLGGRRRRHVLVDWRPDDEGFWAATGRQSANRNLWLSMPPLLLAFAVWVVWSVIVVELPHIGFKFSTNQLFWLAALPGLSGAIFRALYSFVVPIFGGRNFTVWSTAMLVLPTLWIGFAVQDPNTNYAVFAAIALLCGLGGGNFSSSMANISFFYPKRCRARAQRTPAWATWGRAGPAHRPDRHVRRRAAGAGRRRKGNRGSTNGCWVQERRFIECR
jgi:NNP family nitrate/nitrite transporter-like MFS transporter